MYDVVYPAGGLGRLACELLRVQRKEIHSLRTPKVKSWTELGLSKNRIIIEAASEILQETCSRAVTVRTIRSWHISANPSQVGVPSLQTTPYGGQQSTAAMAPIDVLSDTMGVNFGPYLSSVLQNVCRNWYLLIPEAARPPMMKMGKVTIEFSILKDGIVTGMRCR